MHGQHDRIEGENLRFRILLPFILALALILGSFVFGVYQLQQREIYLQTSDHLKISNEIFARQLVEEATNLSSIINVLNQDKDLQAAWSERDRSAIRLKLMPIFEQLASENQLTQLYLHDVDRVNFIRIHKTQRTEKFGDVVNRHTLIEAERTGQPYFGVELGSMGIFTLRVVHPWIIDGELVGYIELGNEIGHISQEIHEDLGVDFIVTIYKFFLIRDRWERGLQMLGREGHWEQLPNMVVIDKTVTQIPPDLKKLLGAEKRVYLEPISKVTIAGRKYGVGMFPLKDVARGYVGEMVVLYDITERVAALRSSILVIGGICFLVGVILFLLFYTILGRTERMLIESRKKLLKEGQVREAEQVRHLEELEREHTALLASEFRFRDIALSTSDWLWEVDAQGVYTFCSEKIEQVLGYGPQEVVGKTPFDLMLPEEAEKIRHQFQKIIAAKAPIIDLENWNSHKNGHTVCLLTNGVPLLDAQGNLIGYRGADKDITDRKLAEREKERLETQLRQAQKMEAIGTLAGGIAHDFNNILAAMLGYADMAEKEIPEGNSAREDLEAVLEAGNRAKDLVKQILAFSRQTEHKSQPIQIRPVVKEVLKLLRASLPSTIEIHEDINENCGAVMGDPTQIHQVLMNLCSNALYAMREKGGVLEVRLDAVNVNVEQAQANPNLSEGPYVVLTVRDTGHGMNASTLERIFEPFYTKKPVGEGTGMGLSTTHGIVKSHNGAMMVTSELGKGSTFQVY
ncbi:PAS domain S-box protein, partial [bacterium]|nr:PAS domain S-box protein [bacterium]